LIALDTNILIYASKLPTDPDPDGFHQSARELISHLSSDNTQKGKRVLLPSIVLAEYLIPIEKAKRGSVLKNLEKWVFVAGFDAQAASIAANLFPDAVETWRKEKATNPESEYARKSRQVLKSDVLILATVIAHGGSRFYTTNDGDFLKISAGQIEIKPLPNLQPTLFSNFLLEKN
jgi:predicted nucleic acid-binding protein